MAELLPAHSTDALLIESLVVIAAAVCSVALASRLRLPVVIGYLIAGWAIGPHGLQLMAASHETRFLAELGIIFLMFMVGLEFSVPAMLRAGRDVLGGGSLQVALTAALVAAGAAALGATWPAAIVLGGAVAMSSTAITLKQLTDQGEARTGHGRLALGILLFQDLATVPFLTLVSAGGTAGGSSVAGLLTQLGLAVVVPIAAVVISRPVFGRVLAWVARSRSSDLFLLAVLLLALGTAYAADVAGLAAPIGAFLAGVVIAESDFRHQIQDDIRPFRDVLVGLFFVTVGMEVAPASAAGSPWAVLAWIMVFVPGKAAVALLSGVLLRWPLQTAVRVAIILSHGGEFGLLLLTQALAVGMIAPALGQPALLALAITMGLAPLLIQNNGRIARLVVSGFWRPAAEREEGGTDPESGNGRGHVLVCGYGRIGRLVVTVLEAANVPCVTLEADLERFRQAKEQGCRVVFGDASRSTVLEAAGLPRATLIVVTFDHRPAVERLLHHVRDAHPGLPSLLSTADDTEVSALSQAGVTAVFPENLAAGLALADQALVLSGFSQERAARVITEVRAQLNPELQGRVGI